MHGTNFAVNCKIGGKPISLLWIQLAGTIPGVELNIDSKSAYVLVDISPGRSLWPPEEGTHCRRGLRGHVHPPLWRQSVIIVCQEVDVQTTTSSPAILRYSLRLITTLEWNCTRPNSLDNKRSWLPFKPSLEHMRSVVCNVEGKCRSGIPLCSLDVFCDPAAAAGLPAKNGRRE